MKGHDVLNRFDDARVLIIDDNVANIQLLVSVLERAGLHNIISATSGRTGLDLARNTELDLVLLDLHMPRMDGYAVLEELASTSTSKYLPILVLTADNTKESAHRALSLGARDFLTKPFDSTEVTLRVRNLLETRFLYLTLRQHNEALADELERRLEVERTVERDSNERYERIEKMLFGDEMSLVFQPIVDVLSREIVGMEALSRFAAEPLRSPDLWFIEASSVGLGPELEMKAVSAAVDELERLPAQSFLAVNVSPELVMSGKLESLVERGICERLVLELTEHVAVDDYDPIRREIAPLRDRGARVAIDDAGAGFASLRHILLLRPEIIKLDRSLTHGVDEDPVRRALAASLVSFASDVGAHLVAEGVETEGELSTLRVIGAEWVQGYHIAMPERLGV
jgi:EAL domain-containing protein (putative c-di-GMP-specific phosphodiesterase class I)